jgi:hypothetical protein
MKWTIRLELTPDGNPPISYEIGSITRPIADLCPEQVGLTLEEGQLLLRRIQMQIIGSQAHAYALCRRSCAHCGERRRIKDIRTKCVQTIFGAFRFRGRRYRACGCCDEADGYRQDFPLGEIIPRRTTPEVRYLFAELGARMPYRAASRVIKVCGFGDMRASYMAIRRHTLAIGRELEAQQPSTEQEATDALEPRGRSLFAAGPRRIAKRHVDRGLPSGKPSFPRFVRICSCDALRVPRPHLRATPQNADVDNGVLFGDDVKIIFSALIAPTIGSAASFCATIACEPSDCAF